MHVAAGAAAGELVGSRSGAVAAGLVLHGVQDAVPHQDIPSHRFEAVSGVLLLVVLALRRGCLDPAVLGGAAAPRPTSSTCCPCRGRAAASSTPPTASKAGTAKAAFPRGRNSSRRALSSPL